MSFKDFMQDDSVLTLEELKTFSPAQQKKIKRLVMTDVFWAAQKIFRSPSQPPLRSFHCQICEALPQPNPDIAVSEWSPIKESVILAFRGACKTTITSGYVVQCVLCAPDIRV